MLATVVSSFTACVTRVNTTTISHWGLADRLTAVVVSCSDDSGIWCSSQFGESTSCEFSPIPVVGSGLTPTRLSYGVASSSAVLHCNLSIDKVQCACCSAASSCALIHNGASDPVETPSELMSEIGGVNVGRPLLGLLSATVPFGGVGVRLLATSCDDVSAVAV